MQEFLHKMIFALIAGFSEFLPVSAPAHQMLYEHMTNRQAEPLLLLAVHIGCLAACLVCCGKRMKRMFKEKRLSGNQRRRGRIPDPIMLMDRAIYKTAAVPVLIGSLFCRLAPGWIDSVILLSLTLFLGSILLFIPCLTGRGNKDGRSLSRFDGLLMGLGGMLGTVPGFSRVGCAYTVGILRGADHSYAMETALLLSVPALGIMICFDIYALTIAEAGLAVLSVLGCLLAGIVSFACGYLTIALLRYFAGKFNISGFAYYSCGLSFFTLLMYLIIY